MRGVKVQGHASMMRSNSCPGAIICTDHAAGMAALQSRVNSEMRDTVIEQQASEIERLNQVVQLMAQHLGIEIPTGGEDEQLSE